MIHEIGEKKSVKLWKLAQHACQLKHLEEIFHCDNMKFTINTLFLISAPFRCLVF